MGEIIVVFDTNVLVSALGWNGTPEECLLYGLRGDGEMLISPETATELWRVLAYDHLPFTETERIAFYHLVFTASTLLTPEIDVTVADDPDDDAFVELAVAGDADILVSGDDHLLGVDRYDGVKIAIRRRFSTSGRRARRIPPIRARSSTRPRVSARDRVASRAC